MDDHMNKTAARIPSELSICTHAVWLNEQSFRYRMGHLESKVMLQNVSDLSCRRGTPSLRSGSLNSKHSVHSICKTLFIFIYILNHNDALQFVPEAESIKTNCKISHSRSRARKLKQIWQIFSSFLALRLHFRFYSDTSKDLWLCFDTLDGS